LPSNETIADPLLRRIVIIRLSDNTNDVL
jgi:hypothetical protein